MLAIRQAHDQMEQRPFTGPRNCPDVETLVHDLSSIRIGYDCERRELTTDVNQAAHRVVDSSRRPLTPEPPMMALRGSSVGGAAETVWDLQSVRQKGTLWLRTHHEYCVTSTLPAGPPRQVNFRCNPRDTSGLGSATRECPSRSRRARPGRPAGACKVPPTSGDRDRSDADQS